MDSTDNRSIDQLLGVLGVRQLIDALPHMIWMANRELGCQFANQRWEDYSGIRIPDLLGYQWTSLMHTDDRQPVMTEWERATTTGTEFQIECRIRRRDGAFRWFDNRGVPLRNPEGNTVRWLGTCTDIHDIYAARDALAENEERLRYVELATHDAIYDWDMRSGVTHRNEAFRNHYGAPESAHNNERWWEQHIHPDDRKRVIDSAAASFRARLPTWEDEYRFLRPDGSYATVIDRGYLLYDADSKPLRMIGATADITARKEVEQSLRDAQARLLSAMEAGGFATWIWDVESDEIKWDDAAFRLWGRRREDTGKLSFAKVKEFILPEDRERVETDEASFYRTGIDKPSEFRTIRPDGELQWLYTKGQIERDSKGVPVRMAGVFIDITHRKRDEEAQLRTQKMEALGTLAGGIAHDFNNILLAINGNTKLALEDLRADNFDPTTVRRSLVEIDKASSRAADLVRRILTFSRQQEAQREIVHLHPVVEEALRLLRPMLPANVKIRASYADNVDPVATDAIQIQQVVMNLVTNATHAIGNGNGLIEINLHGVDVASNEPELQGLSIGKYACLSVSDNGTGIEAGIIDRIFDPFFTTKEVGQGTGLGLAVVHGIVKSHGGAIAVYSEAGKGTKFRVLLPVSAGPTTSRETPLLQPVRGAGQHVLYVDDEEPLVFLVTRVLERMGYRVTGFVDPQLAVEELTARPQAFDVLVTDLSMRGMTGFDLARAARKIRADLPILLTSGYLRMEDREAALSCGIREMILKPNTVEELGLAIDRELRSLR